jgi:hypothetical protein
LLPSRRAISSGVAPAPPCKQQGKIQAGAQISPYLRALFEAGAANNRSVTGQEQEKRRRVSHFFRGSPTRDKKPPAVSRARAIMRSFGEYSFLEDSRYASQQKSAGLS